MAKGMGSPRLMVTAALAFVSAAFSAVAARHQQRDALAARGIYRAEASSAHKRAALKTRNRARNRAAHRG
jgi:hypothetical protein